MVVSFRTRRMPELLTSPTAAFSLVVRSTPFLLSLGKHVVSNNIGSESNDGDAEAREDVPEHGCSGKDGVISPRLAFCPWVAV